MEPEKETSSQHQNPSSLLGLAYILVSFFALFIMSRKKPAPPKNNPDDTRQAGQNVTGSPTRVIIEALPPAPAPTEEEKTQKKFDKRFKWGKAILEVLAFMGLVAYVCETHWTNTLTKQSLGLTQRVLDAERARFAQIQRPWVGLNGPLVILKPTHEGNPPIIAVGLLNATMKNFGPSPALNVIADVKFVPGPRSTDIRPKIEEVCKELERNINPLNVGVALFPGDTSSFQMEYPLKQWSEATIFFFPGCIIYRQQDGTVRRTKICQWADSDHMKPGSTLSVCARESAE